MKFFDTKLIKYLIVIGLIYYILKVIPSDKLNSRDIVLILTIICLAFICMECIFSSATPNSNEKFTPNSNEIATASYVCGATTSLDVNNDAQRNKEDFISLGNISLTGTGETLSFSSDTTKQIGSVLQNTAASSAQQNALSTQTTTPMQTTTMQTTPMQTTPMQTTPMQTTTTPVQKTTTTPVQIQAKNNLGSYEQTGCSAEVQKIKAELNDELAKLRKINGTNVSATNVSATNVSGTNVSGTNVSGTNTNNNYNSSNDRIAERYMNTLISELESKKILDVGDIENIKLKMASKLLSMNDVIISLEMMKASGKPKQVTANKLEGDFEYNELPNDFFRPIGDKIANNWDNDYTLLNTNRWTVPMPRPPVCINSTKPYDVNPVESSSNVVKLREWNNSLKVSNNVNINKNWSSAN